jgi:hypothetical protein
MNEADVLRARIRWLTWLIIVGLIFSGVTAMPLRAELNWVVSILPHGLDEKFGIGLWLTRVSDALNVTYVQYPFMAYGTDWLAFAHFVIAFAFVWPLKDPIRYALLFTWGFYASLSIVLFALVMGQVRGIPWGWRLIDCSFGLAGVILFSLCRRSVARLEQISKSQ